MRERAALIDADLEVGDNLPSGTVVAVRLAGPGVSSADTDTGPDTLSA